VGATKPSARTVLLYRFGPYEADPTRDELRKFGLRLRIEPKPWHLLVSLLERRGQLVSRNELQRALWAEDVFVDFEHGLNVAVKKLRAALSDSAEVPIYIETVAGWGYRFVAEVEQVVANPPASTSPEPIVDALVLKVQSQSSMLLPDAPVLEPERGAKLLLSAVRGQQSWLQKRRMWPDVAIAVSVALLAIVVARQVQQRLPQPEQVLGGKIMLVVLPFENLSVDPGQEYFSDGMTEELSEQLGNLSPQRLGVIGRTSAMIYKHAPKTISQIGKDLGVGYVLEGSVRRDGSKLRVTAQLVQVSDQAHVWAQNYDRDVRDLLQVEDDVASDIAQQVGVSFALGPPTKSSHPHIPNPEAHEAYLLARYYWNKRTPAGWANGEQYFRRAVEKDSQYAAAYAGLAECRIPKQEALTAARKAVELDPSSGEARTALGWVEYFKEWDFVAAEDALKTAIQLDPNYAPAHHLYSGVLALSGRFQESIDQEKQAVRLDPLALIFRANLAGGLSLAGQNDQAIEEIKQIFAIDPQYPKAHETLGTLYLRRGMYKEAIREFEASERYGGAKELGVLGYAYARSGDKEQAVRMLSQLEDLDKRSPSGNVSGDLAIVEMGLGNRDAALAWLEKEYQQHDDDGPWDAKFDPIFEPLRSDPRFQNLLRRMNFPS
jgi:TolB-like protein/DNA-binding winged helix-turn-helix (wHTH) protein/Flp pilus assembly protein TadD